MNKDEILGLLKRMHEGKDAVEAIAEQADKVRQSEAWPFLLALKEHMIGQTLRSGSESMLEFGKIQGINATIDFFDWITSYAKSLDEKAEETDEVQTKKTVPVPTGYGSI